MTQWYIKNLYYRFNLDSHAKFLHTISTIVITQPHPLQWYSAWEIPSNEYFVSMKL